MKMTAYIMLVVLAASSPAWPAAPEAPVQAWFPKALALSYRQGPAVTVSDADGLIRALAEAQPGQTILLADGL